ncbi:unnamed protein product [Amoebophrya sp. A120]|nr:unnamed protein product [Amoebophrya sp. A120]|eukprot:GSA120T00013745001.1
MSASALAAGKRNTPIPWYSPSSWKSSFYLGLEGDTDCGTWYDFWNTGQEWVTELAIVVPILFLLWNSKVSDVFRKHLGVLAVPVVPDYENASTKKLSATTASTGQDSTPRSSADDKNGKPRKQQQVDSPATTTTAPADEQLQAMKTTSEKIKMAKSEIITLIPNPSYRDYLIALLIGWPLPYLIQQRHESRSLATMGHACHFVLTCQILVLILPINRSRTSGSSAAVSRTAAGGSYFGAVGATSFINFFSTNFLVSQLLQLVVIPLTAAYVPPLAKPDWRGWSEKFNVELLPNSGIVINLYTWSFVGEHLGMVFAGLYILFFSRYSVIIKEIFQSKKLFWGFVWNNYLAGFAVYQVFYTIVSRLVQYNVGYQLCPPAAVKKPTVKMLELAMVVWNFLVDKLFLFHGVLFALQKTALFYEKYPGPTDWYDQPAKWNPNFVAPGATGGGGGSGSINTASSTSFVDLDRFNRTHPIINVVKDREILLREGGAAGSSLSSTPYVWNDIYANRIEVVQRPPAAGGLGVLSSGSGNTDSDSSTTSSNVTTLYFNLWHVWYNMCIIGWLLGPWLILTFYVFGKFVVGFFQPNNSPFRWFTPVKVMAAGFAVPFLFCFLAVAVDQVGRVVREKL